VHKIGTPENCQVLAQDRCVAEIRVHAVQRRDAEFAADRVWRGGFRLNLPPADAAPAPDVDAAAPLHAAGTESSTLVAPMPGTVIRVAVRAGAAVAAGDPLVVLEAMKMETPLPSPYDATVKAVHVEEGDRVERGALLVELDE